MQSYRCYFLNFQSAIVGVEIVKAETDDEALQLAQSAFDEKGVQFSGFELWHLDRRIH